MTRRRRLTPLVAIFGSALATIDGAIVDVALRSDSRESSWRGGACAPSALAGTHARQT
jgi:hypothetical protein